MLNSKYKEKCEKKSDINQLLPILKKYSDECETIIEMGVRSIVSTWAFLEANPKKLISYDIKEPPKQELDYVYNYAKENNIDFTFHLNDVLKVDIIDTDLLFIDTWHVYQQLIQELNLHSPKVKKYIAMHDTTLFGKRGEDRKSDGLLKALDEFLLENSEWEITEQVTYNNGLTVLKRKD